MRLKVAAHDRVIEAARIGKRPRPPAAGNVGGDHDHAVETPRLFRRMREHVVEHEPPAAEAQIKRNHVVAHPFGHQPETNFFPRGKQLVEVGEKQIGLRAKTRPAPGQIVADRPRRQILIGGQRIAPVPQGPGGKIS